MNISELIAVLEDIRYENGDDIEVFITNMGTGVSGEVDSVDMDSDVVQIYARHMDMSLDED